MTAPVLGLSEVAAEWRASRKLYPIYAALASRFELSPPCRDLESPVDRNDPDALTRITQWFAAMDDKIQPVQLRQLLQGSKLGNEETLRAITTRYVEKTPKQAADRDKLDFLVVQYLAHRAPMVFLNRQPSFTEVAEYLEPLFGTINDPKNGSAQQLDELLLQLHGIKDLQQLLNSGLLERGRGLKDSAGEQYFQPESLIAFARYNFLIRRAFFRVVRASVHDLRAGIIALEKAKVQQVDCSEAGLSKAEPVSKLQKICEDWKSPFLAAYAPGNNFRMLAQLVSIVQRQAERHIHIEPGLAAAGVMGAVLPEIARLTPSDSQAIAIAQKPAQPITVLPESVSSDTDQELQAVMHKISAQVAGAPGQSAGSIRCAIDGHDVVLATWEVAAYVNAADEPGEALQRAVAARTLLSALRSLEHSRSVAERRLAIAHAEAAQIQAAVARAKEVKNIDAAVNLAATAKRLLSMIEETERTLSKPVGAAAHGS